MISDRLRQSEAYKEFAGEVRDGKTSHAYIVIGDDHESRRAYMMLLAMTLLCRYGACGECETCTKVLSLTHSDLHVYNKDGKMTVKDTEKLISEAYLSSWAQGRKLFFIDNAETMSPAVQNKLLKIIEEPEKDVVIILFASSEVPLLSTVKSRAKKCYLPLFAASDIYDELVEDGVPRSAAEIAAALSGGSFEKAIKLSGDEGYISQYNEVFGILTACKRSSDIANYIYNDVFTKEKIALTLDFTEIILRDALIQASGSDARLSTRNRDYDLSVIANGAGEGALAMAIIAVNKARRMLAANVSPTSVAETLLFDILEAKYRWR